jgi:hypothetical protein
MLTTSIGVDFVQEKFMGGGDQSNESAVEQAKDEQVSLDCTSPCETYADFSPLPSQISDFLRGQYKSTTGSDMPIKDKETRFG